MLNEYLQIFETVCIQFAPLIIPVFAIYLVINMVASLLFDR